MLPQSSGSKSKQNKQRERTVNTSQMILLFTVSAEGISTSLGVETQKRENHISFGFDLITIQLAESPQKRVI
jgi:hypothetical protein